MDLSVIVPVYNEENELARVSLLLARHLDRIAGKGRWQYVYSDNGSTDRSPALIEKLIRRYPGSVFLSAVRPDYGQSLRRGLMAAGGAYAYIMNVDWWNPVFLEWSWRRRDRYDLIIGSKMADARWNWQPRRRKLLSWGFNTILRLFFGFTGSDTHGQKFIRLAAMKPVLEECVMSRSHFDTEFVLLAIRKGLRIAEIPVPVEEIRKERQWVVRKIGYHLWDLPRLRRAIRKTPVLEPARYDRWRREDLLEHMHQPEN